MKLKQKKTYKHATIEREWNKKLKEKITTVRNKKDRNYHEKERNEKLKLILPYSVIVNET